MPLQHQFTCRLRNGVHARPASILEEVTQEFDAEFTLINQRTGHRANSKSVLSIISADIRHNDPCLLTISGHDEQAALDRLTVFLEKDFLTDNEPPAAEPEQNGGAHLPAALHANDAIVFEGRAVVPGIGKGRVVRMDSFQFPAIPAARKAVHPATEWEKLAGALEKLAAAYDRQLARTEGKVEAGMLRAQRAIVRDPEFRGQLEAAVRERQQTAAGAVTKARDHFCSLLKQTGNAMLSERSLDIQDVCMRLLREMDGTAAMGESVPRLETDSIVAAETLTPGQFLALNRRWLKGLVLGKAGHTSHTVILARSFGIPTLTGPLPARAQWEGQEAILDTYAGVLLTQLTPAARRYYAMEDQRLAGRQARLKQFRARPAATKDGHLVEIGANIAGVDEADSAFDQGAEGIGLFRTEIFFSDRNSPPDETEQFEAYRRVLLAAGDRPVIIRTLDAGGDKPLPYLHLPAEDNPFLGYRAVRLYQEFETIFRTQIRALLRASAHGRLKVMLPMISTVAEVRWVKSVIESEQANYTAAGIPFNPDLPLGAMIEVPAAAFALADLCRELDFFSIGSNDLLQYFTAADRANPRVSHLYQPLQPAFLRLLKHIGDEVRAERKWIGLCGELGGQTLSLPLLAGLGLDEISVNAPLIAGLKAELAKWTLADCQELLAAALACVTVEEVTALLQQASGRHGAPLMAPELVLVKADAATKDEAIKLAVDELYILGRTEDSRAVEAAVQKREAAYSTGFGHGFAIPHCKSDAVRDNSLVLLKLQNPVDWNALDGRPVDLLFLLAIREGDGDTEHMKVLARLARSVMNEDFRNRLRSENDPAALHQFLSEALTVPAGSTTRR